MAGVKLQAIDLKVSVFTSLFQVRGNLRVSGILQTILNDESNASLSIMNAEILSYDGNGPAVSMSQPEFIIAKNAALIIFDKDPEKGAISFLPRMEQAVAYTAKFAIQAKFYMGTESNIQSFVGSSAGAFLAFTDVHLFPLVPVHEGIVSEGPVGVIHKSLIQSIHTA